eukprot:COSAG01_NODE_2417_length_7736_cov_7.862511_5_plen_124_part_00
MMMMILWPVAAAAARVCPSHAHLSLTYLRRWWPAGCRRGMWWGCGWDRLSLAGIDCRWLGLTVVGGAAAAVLTAAALRLHVGLGWGRALAGGGGQVRLAIRIGYQDWLSAAPPIIMMRRRARH